uniref:Glycine-rich protein n=1 Tax=Fagus sylvatica TaxID=28930 RepID=A0A2N9EXD9_FAGSY
MERVTKVLLMLTMLLLVLSSDVEGGRQLKSNEKVEHPQNFAGGMSGIGGFIPSPGFAGGIGSGPSSFCSFSPGGCVPAVFPTIPGSPLGVGSPLRKNEGLV